VDLPQCAQRLEVVGKERGLKRMSAMQKIMVVSWWKGEAESRRKEVDNHQRIFHTHVISFAMMKAQWVLGMLRMAPFTVES